MHTAPRIFGIIHKAAYIFLFKTFEKTEKKCYNKVKMVYYGEK